MDKSNFQEGNEKVSTD